MPLSSLQSRRSMLLSSGRSGTNYFLTVYATLFPEDITLREIFRREGDSIPALRENFGLSEEDAISLAQTNKSLLWERVFNCPTQQPTRGIIAKIFYNHANESDSVWNLIKEHCRIIHLIRRNQFDVFVSLQMALKTGRWHNFGNHSAPPDVSITIDRTELEEFINKKRRYIEWARDVFSSSPCYTELFYEDLALSPQACSKAICEIYGIRPPESITIRQKRQKVVPNFEIVTNYDEVSDLDANIQEISA